MGAFMSFKSSQNNGNPKTEVRGHEWAFRYLYHQPRELSVATGTGPQVRLPSLRRIKSFQGFKHKKVQGIKETHKELQAALNLNGDAFSTGLARLVEPGGHIRLRAAFGDEFDPIPGQVYGSWPKE
jgi:hypothetical protein